MTSQARKKTIIIHILSNILRSKGNQTMKFGQLIEYIMTNIFLEKSYTKCCGETIPKPFLKKLKLSIFLDLYLKVLHSYTFFKEKLRQHIQAIKNDNELFNDPQIKWEFLKYQIRKFTKRFSKMRAKEERKRREEVEATLKLLEKNHSTEENQCLYNKCKRDLEEIYDNIAEEIRIRSRCQWYEEGEKSSKSFLNLEKFNGMQSQIRKMIVKKYLILI